MNDPKGSLCIMRLLIGPVSSQGIKCIGDGNNAGEQWNFFTLQTPGVTASIE